MSIKSQLVSELSHKFPNITEKEVSSFINILLSEMISHLAKKGRIEIRNFGTFNLHYKPSRQAHNPKTGKKLITIPKYVVHFKPGKAMKNKVNQELKPE